MDRGGSPTGGRRPRGGADRLPPTGAIPLWLKVAYSAFIVVWVPVYLRAYGAGNFLWICDVANFLLLPALWAESALLVSSQAVAVLVIQALWLVDVLGRALFGFHPIGGTEYMFDPAKPLTLRALSLFHVAVPVLLLWAIRRLGYDPRGWKLQTLIVWLLLPLTWVLTDPAANVNWLWRPFGIEPPLLPAPWGLPAAMLALPLVLYLPTHLALARWVAPAGRGLTTGRRRGAARRSRSG